MGKPKLLILEGKSGPRVTAFCDGPAVNDEFDVVRSGDITGNPDLIYCQTYGQRNSFEQLAKWRGPYVLHVGGDIWNERRESKGAETLSEIMRVMWRAKRVVCVSQFLADTVEHHLGGSETVKHVLGLPGGLWGTDHTDRGIDPSKFKPKESYAINGRPLIVMNINLTVHRKWRGVPIFMNAAHDVLKKHDALIVCVGKVKKNRHVANDWRARWDLEVIPPSHRWPELLRQADLFVHPSMFDGFPRAVAEACCVGVPGVLFDEAGTPEVSIATELVSPDDPEKIAAKVSEMLSLEDMREKVGRDMRRESLTMTENYRDSYANTLLNVLNG